MQFSNFFKLSALLLLAVPISSADSPNTVEVLKKEIDKHFNITTSDKTEIPDKVIVKLIVLNTELLERLTYSVQQLQTECGIFKKTTTTTTKTGYTEEQLAQLLKLISIVFRGQTTATTANGNGGYVTSNVGTQIPLGGAAGGQINTGNIVFNPITSTFERQQGGGGSQTFEFPVVMETSNGQWQIRQPYNQNTQTSQNGGQGSQNGGQGSQNGGQSVNSNSASGGYVTAPAGYATPRH